MNIATPFADEYEKTEAIVIEHITDKAEKVLYVSAIDEINEKSIDTYIPLDKRNNKWQVYTDFRRNKDNNKWIRKFVESDYQMYVKITKKENGMIEVEGV